MKAMRWFLAAMAPLALVWGGAAVLESCGAMNFELPVEEPLPEAAPPPRLVRRDAGAAEPGLGHSPRP
jgi:hypothetical protein